MNFLQKLSYLRALGHAQQQATWLDQFELRDMTQPLVLKNSTLQWLFDQGITNYATGEQWLQKWYADGAQDLPIFIMGSRDLCWHVSWLIEIIEGRIEDDVPAKIPSQDYYLCSRYGTRLGDSLCNPPVNEKDSK